MTEQQVKNNNNNKIQDKINTINHNNNYPTLPAEASSTTDEVFEVQFPDLPSLECGGNSCTNGHRWQVIGQLTSCPGCGGGVVIVKMSNCPICNEPSLGVNLTTVFVPSKTILSPCKEKKELSNGRPKQQQQESVEVQIERPTVHTPYAPIKHPVDGPNW